MKNIKSRLGLKIEKRLKLFCVLNAVIGFILRFYIFKVVGGFILKFFILKLV